MWVLKEGKMFKFVPLVVLCSTSTAPGQAWAPHAARFHLELIRESQWPSQGSARVTPRTHSHHTVTRPVTPLYQAGLRRTRAAPAVNFDADHRTRENNFKRLLTYAFETSAASVQRGGLRGGVGGEKKVQYKTSYLIFICTLWALNLMIITDWLTFDSLFSIQMESAAQAGLTHRVCRVAKWDVIFVEHDC